MPLCFQQLRCRCLNGLFGFLCSKLCQVFDACFMGGRDVYRIGSSYEIQSEGRVLFSPRTLHSVSKPNQLFQMYNAIHWICNMYPSDRICIMCCCVDKCRVFICMDAVLEKRRSFFLLFLHLRKKHRVEELLYIAIL